MSYDATGNSAGRRITALLDEGSFVEIGGAVTARSTNFNLQEKETPSDGVVTGYGTIDGDARKENCKNVRYGHEDGSPCDRTD